MKIKKSFAAIASAAALTLAMVACGKTQVIANEISDDGTMTYKVENCKTDDEVSGTFVVPDGATSMTVTSELTEGKLHVTLSESPLAGVGMDDEEADEDASAEELEEGTDSIVDAVEEGGKVISELSLEPGDSFSFDIDPAGDYMLTVHGDDDAPATGTAVVTFK